MPFIAPETVKEIRQRIKKEFPKFKFSVTTKNYSTVLIHILEGPIDFGKLHEQVNPYYIKEHYQGQAKEVLQKIYDIANKGNGTENLDGDYGAIPSFYVRIIIGEWDKPYVIK